MDFRQGRSEKTGCGGSAGRPLPAAWPTDFRVGRHLALAASCLLSVAGCVAVPVGKTIVHQCEVAREEMDSRPERTTLERARVNLSQRGAKATVSIDAELREEHLCWRHVKKVTVRQQKRLAFGLFPGAAELVWMPEGALGSAETLFRVDYDPAPRYCGYYVDRDPGLGTFFSAQVLPLLPFGAIATCESLLVAPFEPWHCESHDYIDPACWKRGVERNGRLVADASESPRIRALAELPEELRREIGVRTCFDVRSTLGGEGRHLGWLGFHKYLAVFVDVAESKEQAGKDSRRRKTAVEGPCEIELSIPGIGYADRRTLLRGDTSVAFDLPPADREMSIEARVTVRDVPWEESGEPPEWTREAIRNLMGQASRFDVNLRAGAGGVGTTEGEPFEIEEIHPSREGGYRVRMRVADPSRRDTVAVAVAPEVRRRIREDYANRHPSARVSELRDWVSWKAPPDDPSILEFEGWAFSVRPLPNGRTYNARTHRAEIRLFVSGNLPEGLAEQWARENIADIAADKAFALEGGNVFSEDAAYRCLDAQCNNGILSVEFEIVGERKE